MKRSGPPPRKTPLRQKTPIKKVSSKQRRKNAEFREQKRRHDGALCKICGKLAVTLHHITYRSRCGGNETQNLMPICGGCHRWIHAHPAQAKELGWTR